MRESCGGIVRRLEGHHVLFTGKTWVRGRRVHKDELRRIIRQSGGTNAPDRSRSVTLLVIGDLRGQVIVDPVNVRSQKVVFVDDERRRGNHICVVDGAGFTGLLDGRTATCLKTRAVENGKDRDVVEVSHPDQMSEELSPTSVLGARLPSRTATHHDDGLLELDLSALDRATEAHERIIEQLKEHLVTANVTVRTSGAGMPQFDAGWVAPRDEKVVMIAEVKSLTGAVGTQQIRLGLGQVLDYAHDVRRRTARAGLTVVPVLVVQHQPAQDRWASLADSLGVVLTWPPDFPGL